VHLWYKWIKFGSLKKFQDVLWFQLAFSARV